MLVVWSHASVESHWVEIEAGKGRERGCLVPLKLDEVEPPFGFEHIQAADFTRWSGDTDAAEWQDLIAAVERCVPRSTRDTPDTTTQSSTQTLHPEETPNTNPQSDPSPNPPDPDLSHYWERLLAKPSLDQLEQLTAEVTAMREMNTRSPGLITLQRRVAGALAAARQVVAQPTAAAPPPKSGKHYIWVWIVAGIVVLVAAWIFMRMGPNNAAIDRAPETGGQSTTTTPDPASEPTPPPGTADTGQLSKPMPTPADVPLPELVEIPKGCFQMGSAPGVGSDDERPQHRVCLDSFHISRHEVTFDQYDAFARSEKRKLPDAEDWGRKDRPVINVSWSDAQDYVRWLSTQTHQTCTLPSEAQWEYAARAGTTKPYALPAPNGSDDIAGKGLANCNGCGSRWDEQTAPVGSFPANAWGLHDTHGNVWEWVQDHYHDSYEGAPTDGSAWEKAGSNEDPRVLRGGSWNSNPGSARASNRDGYNPDSRNYDIGFRVVCSSPISR